MTAWRLFTDGSVNTQTRNGCGAALLIPDETSQHTLEELRALIKVQTFTDTSSTQIELQTLLWALASAPATCAQLTVYTDSQNTISLAGRRAGFEAQNYHSKKGIPLRNTELYQAYFQMSDQLKFRLVKIKGHKPAAQRNAIDQIFNLVDKASRAACKQIHRS